MGPKRASQPSSVPANAVASGLKPSSAASSQHHTTSTMKSQSSTSATTSSSTTTSSSSSTTRQTSGSSASKLSATNTSSTSTPSSPTSGKKGARSTTSSTTPAGTLAEAQNVIASVWDRYVKETPQRVKLVDAFMAFLVVLGGVQFAYCVLAGNYPFNAFLAGFSATVGQFVLTASLRMQTNPANKAELPTGFSDERAFADYVFGSLLLHFFCVNFIN